MECNPDDWLETVDTQKQTINNNVRGRSNKTNFQRSSSNLVENTTETVSTAKFNNSTYTPAATGKSEFSHYVCAFCRANGHVMWRCNKYLKLNLDERLEYVKEHDRCTNCLGNRLDHCTSRRTCLSASNSTILLYAHLTKLSILKIDIKSMKQAKNRLLPGPPTPHLVCP